MNNNNSFVVSFRSPLQLVRFGFDICRYSWLYLKISVHAGIVWGPSATVQDNDAILAARYPLEWQALSDIRRRYGAEPLLVGREQSEVSIDSTEAKTK